jgi:uncharacterized protein (TIGR01777 family)
VIAVKVLQPRDGADDQGLRTKGPSIEQWRTIMRAVVTGATGFVGRRLLQYLDEPIVLTRNPDKAHDSLTASLGKSVTVHRWDAETEPAPVAAFDGVDVVFHLAGEPVAEGRWNDEKKRRLMASRELGTRNLVSTLTALPTKPKVLVSASAVGFYGDRGDETLDEHSAPGKDFLTDVCVAWERESRPAEQAGIRVVNPRIGIVLGRKGGALAKMLPPFYMGAGSPLGSGKQWMPWIHLDELVGLMLFAAEHEQLRGPANATAPHPVTNYDFTKALGRAVHRPTFLPSVPGFVLRAVLGEFAGVLMGSQRAVPAALLAAGFKFQFPQLKDALDDILNGTAYDHRPQTAKRETVGT